MIKIKNKKNKIVPGFKTAKKKSFSFKKVIFWFLSVCFLAVLFLILFFSDFTRIKSIQFDVDNFDQEVINKIVKEESGGKYFNIFPKDNIFIFPAAKIVEKAKKENLLLKEIKIKRYFPGEIAVNVEGRKNVLLWLNQERIYLVDESGAVFLELPPEKKEDFIQKFAIIRDENSRSIKIGEEIISEELASFFFNINSKLQENTGFQFKKELHVPSLVSNEVKIDSENGWALYLNTSQPLEKQLAGLKAFFEKQISREEAEKLEYVDLRLKGRILYKIKEELKSEVEN